MQFFVANFGKSLYNKATVLYVSCHMQNSAVFFGFLWGGIFVLLERLEKLPVGSFHYKLLAVTGLGWLFDAMDTGLISFVLPILSKEWGKKATCQPY